jgi:tubulin polyglutamylase TTLL6/13
MASLAHKHNLSRNLNRMKKIFAQEYDFFPKTWILPSDLGDFKTQFTNKKAKTFIVKPVASC